MSLKIKMAITSLTVLLATTSSTLVAEQMNDKHGQSQNPAKQERKNFESTKNQNNLEVGTTVNNKSNVNSDHQESNSDGRAIKLTQSQVKEVQRKLYDQGFALTADGKMGPKTREALKEFQESKNIEPSGELNQETLSQLDVDKR